MRSSVGGWVRKSFVKPPMAPPRRGFTMASWAARPGSHPWGCAGPRTRGAGGRWRARPALPAISAPVASAWNSLVREMAIWRMIAAMGARIMMRMATTGFRFSPPAEEEAPPGHHGDGTGHHRGQGGDQHVPVLDVGELVGDDALELRRSMSCRSPVVTQTTACRWLAPGGEGVGLLLGGDGHDGHGKAGPLPERVHHVVELGGILPGHHLRLVHAEHEAVPEPVHPTFRTTAPMKKVMAMPSPIRLPRNTRKTSCPAMSRKTLN
jgi:hypothetical protein